MYIYNRPNCSISKQMKREWNSCINTYSLPWDIIVNSEKKKFIES